MSLDELEGDEVKNTGKGYKRSLQSLVT